MGYSFTIGKPKFEVHQQITLEDNNTIATVTRAVSNDVERDVHCDEFEAMPYKGDSHRLISYSTWKRVRELVGPLDNVWDEMERLYGGGDNGQVWKPYVPVTFYLDELDEIETVAEALVDGEERLDADEIPTDIFEADQYIAEHTSERLAAGARALWFVRWSRAAYEEYGEMAVFETPMEWK